MTILLIYLGIGLVFALINFTQGEVQGARLVVMSLVLMVLWLPIVVIAILTTRRYR